MVTLQASKLFSIFIWLILLSLQQIPSINTLATTSSEEPATIVPAMAVSRLPSYEVVESNLTDTPATTVDTDTTLSNVTELLKMPAKVEQQPSSEKNISSAVAKNLSIPQYQTSSSTTSVNYVTIGEGKKKVAFSYSPNYEHVLENGFQPFVPSTLFVPDAIEKPYTATESLADTTFKSNSLSSYRHHSAGDFNNYPSYGEIQTSNYYDPLKYGDEKVHLTEYVPPNMNPMQPPLLVYKPRKKYPTKSHHHQILKAPPYNNHFGKQHFESDFDGLMTYENFHENYNLYEKPSKNKVYKKNGLLHILTTLIPIGLLLAALPPRVVFINSTNPVHPVNKPFFRHIEKELSQMSPYNDTAYNLVTNLGLTPSANAVCNKRKICEVALNGTKPQHSFVENSLWHLLSRSSDVIRTNLNLQDVFEAVTHEQCSRFSCSETEIRTGRLGTHEARQNEQEVVLKDGGYRRTHTPFQKALSQSNR